MTTVRTLKVVGLDFWWINHILVTAFDYAYGASNYWLVQGDVERIGDFLGIEPWVSEDQWYSLTIKGATNTIVVGPAMLNTACGLLLNDPMETHDVHARDQLVLALQTPNETPELDGHTCDVICQLAIYGELKYTPEKEKEE